MFLNFSGFWLFFVVFPRFPARFPTLPALFQSLCFCGRASVDRNLPAFERRGDFERRFAGGDDVVFERPGDFDGQTHIFTCRF